MVVIKANYAGDIRRVSLDLTTFEDLKRNLLSLYKNLSPNFIVKYIDEEGDEITITSTLELQSAIDDKNEQLLRLLLVDAGPSISPTSSLNNTPLSQVEISPIEISPSSFSSSLKEEFSEVNDNITNITTIPPSSSFISSTTFPNLLDQEENISSSQGSINIPIERSPSPGIEEEITQLFVKLNLQFKQFFESILSPEKRQQAANAFENIQRQLTQLVDGLLTDERKQKAKEAIMVLQTQMNEMMNSVVNEEMIKKANDTLTTVHTSVTEQINNVVTPERKQKVVDTLQMLQTEFNDRVRSTITPERQQQVGKIFSDLGAQIENFFRYLLPQANNTCKTTPSSPPVATANLAFEANLKRLIEMGFTNSEVNRELLSANNNDFEATLNDLLNK